LNSISNRSAQEITLQTKSNESVTIDCNTLPKRAHEFLKRATRINQDEGRPWSCRDFPNVSPGNFRQIVSRLKDKIEIVIKSKPCFYKVRGIPLAGDSHCVTFRPTGVSQGLIEILQGLKHQPAAIHDVKLKVNASIHDGLIKRGYRPHPNNNSILVDIPLPNNNIKVKALVYRHSLQIDVGCTFSPIIYDIRSLLTLFEILSQASIVLSGFSQTQLPSVTDWIITHYHFNKDSNVSINGQLFHITVGEATETMITFYSKIMPDGSIIPRIEEICIPNTTFTEEMVKAIHPS